MNLIEMSAFKLRESIVRREVSAVEATKAFLSRIAEEDGKIRSFISVTADEALAQAKGIDEALACGKNPGLLAGVPVAVKDNICTRGVRTTCASKLLERFVPPYDAFVVKRLKEEGAVIIGKTNMDEFAMGSSCENSAFFATRNPCDIERIPGGSSGGSAAAVAAKFACVALGSDTGGSIRQPAALTGTVGFKPTYGMVSRNGLVAFASSLDQIGPIGGNVRDVALTMSVLSREDPGDLTCVRTKRPDFVGGLESPDDTITLGLPKEFLAEGIEPAVRSSFERAVKLISESGIAVSTVSLPMTSYGIPAYYIIAPAEASSNLGRYTGVHYGRRSEEDGSLEMLYRKTRLEGLGPEVKRRIMLGTYTLSSGYYDAYYKRALSVRRLIKEDLDGAFASVDAVIGPTSPVSAFKLGEKISDPLQMYLCDIFTVTANLAGIPGISIPCGKTPQGLPVGFQILGRAFDDMRVLRIARRLEKLFATAL